MSRPALQNPGHYVPGLRSSPWWSPTDVPQAAVLEAHSAAIAREFEDLTLAGRLRLHPHSPGGPRKPFTDQDWNIFELWSNGLPHHENLIETPVTAQVLTEMQDAIAIPRGVVYFSVLQPGQRVRPHCGPTNIRIRLHLGLRVPPGATMRVGTEARTWEEGKCLVFDDSWEHEAMNPSDQPRSVLLVDIWHPDLSAEQRATHGSDAQTVRNRVGRRGWVRRTAAGAIDASGPEPIDPVIFALLDPERLASLSAVARRASALELPVVAEAARRVLRALAAAPDELVSADERSVAEMADDVVWAELAALADNADEHGFESSDLVELAAVCSISWRTWPWRADAMADFLDAWPAADKSACADELVTLRTAARMIGTLGELEVDGNPPPFGALVPLLCAAHRRSSTSGARPDVHTSGSRS